MTVGGEVTSTTDSLQQELHHVYLKDASLLAVIVDLDGEAFSKDKRVPK